MSELKIMQQIIANIQEALELKERILNDAQFLEKIKKSITLLTECYSRGGKVLIAGNGGSAADAQHFAGEIVCTFTRKDRRGYPAIALTTNSSVLTAWSNDFGFESVFSRQVEALGNAGDIFIGVSTSGNSENILKALQKTQEIGLKTIGLLGKEGGKMRGLFDVELIVPSESTPRIQEVHTMLVHIICKEVEKSFPKINRPFA